jgi:uncharacterized membrane protein
LSAERGHERKRWLWTLIAILLLVFAARTLWLDRQFLWWDEGLSVYFANQRLPTMFDEMQANSHTDPPVYNLALAGWRVLAGNSPYAVRFFSVLAGVATVALTWAVGRWLVNRQAALLATVFVALAPMQVHYAREAKGYAFGALFALLSVYAWGRQLGYSGNRLPRSEKPALWWVVYVLSTLAAIGTHYYLGLLLVWQGLWVAGSTVLAPKSSARRAALKRMGQWCLAAAAITLPLVPWVLITLDAALYGAAGVSVAEPLSLFGYLGRMFGTFAAGPGAEDAIALIGGCAVVLLTGIGILSNGRQAFLLSWFAVPLLAAYLVQSAYSFFYPRFLLYLGPPCYLLTALGVATLGRRSPVWHAPTPGRHCRQWRRARTPGRSSPTSAPKPNPATGWPMPTPGRWAICSVMIRRTGWRSIARTILPRTWARN